MSFNNMMQEAIKIRTSTDAKLRVDFDARPKFQQTSMFATKEVCAARILPLEERVAKCTAMKQEGNGQFRKCQFGEACHTYEQALAIFWYLHNSNGDWKSSGIKDEDIQEVNFSPMQPPEDLNRVRDLKVALLLNIARAYSAQSDYATSRKACTAALTANPASAKAFFWRGKGLVSPASAGAFETEEAIRDVSRAAELAPNDGVIRVFLSKLRAEKVEQNKSDRATFAGLFGRGSVCDAGEEVPAKPDHPLPDREGNAGQMLPLPGKGNEGGGARAIPAPVSGEPAAAGGGGDGYARRGANEMETRRDVDNRVAFLERLAEECDAEDREEEAAGYRERVAAVVDALAKHDQEQKRARKAGGGNLAGACFSRGVDWRNPSKAMQKKALDDELDLTNPAVMSFLLKMQETHRRKEEVGRAGANPTSSDPDRNSEKPDSRDNEDEENEDAWSRETWEGAILCMSTTEVTSLLQDSGVDTRPGMTLRELRQTAVEKLLGDHSLAGSKEDIAERRRRLKKEESKPKRVDWRLSMGITLAIFLFKSYQMGVLKWLATGMASVPGPASAPPGSRSAWQQSGGRGRRKGGRGRGESPLFATDDSTAATTAAAADAADAAAAAADAGAGAGAGTAATATVATGSAGTGSAATTTTAATATTAAGSSLAAKPLSTAAATDAGGTAATSTTAASTAGGSLAAKTLFTAATATTIGASGNSLAAKALSAGIPSVSTGCADFDSSSSSRSRDGGWVVGSCGGGEGVEESEDEFAPIERKYNQK